MKRSIILLIFLSSCGLDNRQTTKNRLIKASFDSGVAAAINVYLEHEHEALIKGEIPERLYSTNWVKLSHTWWINNYPEGAVADSIKGNSNAQKHSFE